MPGLLADVGVMREMGRGWVGGTLRVCLGLAVVACEDTASVASPDASPDASSEPDGDGGDCEGAGGQQAASDAGGTGSDASSSTGSDAGNGATDTTDAGPGRVFGPQRCVWNQAYQENYETDDAADAVREARDCYVLIDPFSDARNSIPALQASGNVVGCYISTGTCEDWRDDFDAVSPHCVSEQWGEWAGEYFVDETSEALVAAMKARIDRLADWGCDMVEFDNMDWAFDDQQRRSYGFRASEDEAIAYNQTLCDHTHARGMGCMAKNTRRGAEQFDGVTFESYREERDWWTEAHLSGFLAEDKLGIIVHYDEPDCDGVYEQYTTQYGAALSYICEDRATRRYRHYPAD